MVEAGLWGLVGGASLVLGAAVGVTVRLSPRTIGVIMAFGAGVLISALAFDLAEKAFVLGGKDAFAGGLAVGALAFFLADLALDKRGGRHRKRSGGQQRGNPAVGLVLGAVLDGIPESAVIGIGLLEDPTVSVPVLAAVFLSNLPEAFSSATGMKRGHRSAYVLGVWSLVVL